MSCGKISVFLSQLKLTPEYLEQMKFQAIAANTKVFFGPSIPNIFVDSSMFSEMKAAQSGQESHNKQVCCDLTS